MLFTERLSEVAAFYRAVGLPVEDESHEGGPDHLACDAGGVHFALFEGSSGVAEGFRVGGQ